MSAVAEARALTPSARALARRSVFWLVLAGIVVLVAVVVLQATRGATAPRAPLAADNPAPAGAQALVQVLGDHGVHVVRAHSADEAVQAARGRDATVLVYDPSSFLNAATARRLDGLNLVLVQPDQTLLAAAAPEVRSSGRLSGAARLAPACSAAPAERAGVILASGTLYQGGEGCYPAQGGHLVARAGTVTVLGSADVLANGSIVQAGNAALALGLLGSRETLVWYLPTLADVPASGPPSLSELTPPWVTPVLLLLLATAGAAAFWRGRRFGPLVAEDLPVTVKARETMEGRARLYQRSSARLRALDALRIGALGRLCALAGLGASAPTAEIVNAVARLTGRDAAEVRQVLVDASPARDRELMRLSAALTDLENAVRHAVRQEE